MMSSQTYFRPIGMMAAPAPADSVAVGPGAVSAIGLPLSNTGQFFLGVEAAERIGATVRRRMMPLDEVFQRDWHHATAAGQFMDNLTAPRPRLAGLSLDRPRIMGIVNVTPDSFSDGGRHDTTDRAVEHGLKLAAEGADILDIGGESTRPGADEVATADELARVIPVIRGLRSQTDARISVDTRKAEVMRQAAEAGADIINDISALTHDPSALAVAAAVGLPVVLMHAQGDPKTMNDNPVYGDLVLDVYDFLAQRVAACVAAGIPTTKLCVDPGIGFGKHLHHNVAMMAQLSILHGLGVPILLGASRKKMVSQLADAPEPKDRLPGSLACALAGVAQGVQIVRVHDVAATRQALSVWVASMAGFEAGRGGDLRPSHG